ncbi:MAG: RHS repeat-associated core domain-containing protein [Verrucomicrobiota bacterium]
MGQAYSWAVSMGEINVNSDKPYVMDETNVTTWDAEANNPSLPPAGNINKNKAYVVIKGGGVHRHANAPDLELFSGDYLCSDGNAWVRFAPRPQIIIETYRKDQLAAGNATPAVVTEIHIPERFRAENETWARFKNAGDKLKVITLAGATPVLETTLELGDRLLAANWIGIPHLPDRPVILSHTGLQEGFFHVVRFSGQFENVVYDRPSAPHQPRDYPMFWKPPTASSILRNRIIPACADGYTLEFTNPLPWTTTLLKQPNFHGSPLPSEYLNKSLDELREAASPLALNYPPNSPVLYKALDASPELKTHPVLDRLVQDLGNDPLALANFVTNEIRVTDATREGAVSDFQEASLESQGVKRGALGVLLERQGSPVEQCGLLVYLLRRAGYEALYAFPGKIEIPGYNPPREIGGLSLLDTDVSRLLGMQIAPLAGSVNGSRLIYADYPWVSVYLPDQARWVNVFPWMKDVEIREGEDFWKAMPEVYNSAFKWIKTYLTSSGADGDLLRGDAASESPLTALRRFFAGHLARTQSGKTVSDFETTSRIRKHHYQDWNSLPRPWSIAKQESVRFVDCLNKFDPISEGVIFDKVSISLGLDPDSMAPRPVSRLVCELHNRKLMIKSKSWAALSDTPTPFPAANCNLNDSWRTIPGGGLSVTEAGMYFGDNNYNDPIRVTRTMEMPSINGGQLDFNIYVNVWSAIAPDVNLKILKGGQILENWGTDLHEKEENRRVNLGLSSDAAATRVITWVVTKGSGAIGMDIGGSSGYLQNFNGSRWNIENLSDNDIYHDLKYLNKNSGDTLSLRKASDDYLLKIFGAGAEGDNSDFSYQGATKNVYWKLTKASGGSSVKFQIRPSYPSVTYENGSVKTTLFPNLKNGTSLLERQEKMISTGFALVNTEEGQYYSCKQSGYGSGSCEMTTSFAQGASGSLLFSVGLDNSDQKGLLALQVNGSTIQSYSATALNQTVRIKALPGQPFSVKWVLNKSKGDAYVAAAISRMTFVPDAQVEVQLEPFNPGGGLETETRDVLPAETLSVGTAYSRDRFLGESASQSETGKEGTVEWGDTMALITSVDRVTDDMMREHLVAFQNTADPGKRREYLAYLMGMQYIKRYSEENDTWFKLLKIKDISTHIDGLSGFGADATGNAAYPILDMFSMSKTAFQSSVPARDNLVTNLTQRLAAAIPMVFNGSALEHITINRFFPDNPVNAISTVALLNQARSAGLDVVSMLSDAQRLAKGDTLYNGPGHIATPLKYLAGSHWEVVEKALPEGQNESESNWAFMTPGPMTSGGTAPAWSSMGTFVNYCVEPRNGLPGEVRSAALISPSRLNGGYGNKVDFLGKNNDNRVTNSYLDFQNGDVSVRDRQGSAFQSTWGSNSSSAEGTLDFFSALSNKIIEHNSFPSPSDLDNYEIGINLTGAFGSFQAPSTLTGADEIAEFVKRNWEVGSFQTPERWTESGQIDPKIADPVNIITGEFYNHQVDLELPSPVPMSIVRNYSSRFNASRNIGYGWRLGFEPSLILSDADAPAPAEIQASEMDGSLIQYSLTQAGGNVWRPTGERNPLMGVSGDKLWNPFAKRITRTVENPGTAGEQVVFNLEETDGGLRRYEVPKHLKKSTGTPPNQITIQIKRPLLRLWADHLGNEMRFTYYGDNIADAVESTDPGYGLLRKVQCSNGSSFVFRYNHLGMVSELAAGDGRMVRYSYNDDGDLVQVIRPDNSVFKYEYIKEKMLPAGASAPLEYSTHLIWREERPDGRVVLNKYETDNAGFNGNDSLIQPATVDENSPKVTDKRRVIAQWSTAGRGPVTPLAEGAPPAWNTPAEESGTPVLTAKFDYSHQTEDMMPAVNDPSKQVPTGAVSGYSVLTDIYRRTTTYEYTDSKITRTTDPAGITLEQKWYTTTDAATGKYRDSVEHIIDRRGLKTTYYYNSEGKTVETTAEGDLDGDEATIEKTQMLYEYNELGLLTQTWLPNRLTGLARGRVGGTPGILPDDVAQGNQTVVFYDGTFPRLPYATYMRLPSGYDMNCTLRTYGSVGEASVIPFCRGVILSERSGDGHILEGSQDTTYVLFQYETNGFKKHQMLVTGTEDPTVWTNFKYNDRNELVEETDASGYVKKYAYDDMGRRIWEESFDLDGKQISWNYRYYNLNGELEWTDGPKSGAAEDYSYQRYDRQGNPLESVAWLSQALSNGQGIEQIPGDAKYGVTWKRYNLFGEVVQEIDPLLRTRKTEYDVIGRVLQQSSCADPYSASPVLSLSSFTYADPVTAPATAGGLGPFRKLGSVAGTDELGGVTLTRFTSTGKPAYKKLPDGRELRWRYYLDGRPKKEPLDHWFASEYTYDDASRSETVTQTGNGTALRSTSRCFDARGNVIISTDAAGATTRTQFDKMNRPVLIEGPGDAVSPGRTTLISYPDPAGRRTETTDALGNRSVQMLDVLKRPSVSEVWEAVDPEDPAGEARRVSVQSVEYDPEHHWVLSRSGSGASAASPPQISRVWSNTAGQAVLSQVLRSDNHEIHSYAWTVYDAAGQALRSRPAAGDAFITESAYDGLGRVSQVRQPGGALTRYRYALGRHQAWIADEYSPQSFGMITRCEMPDAQTEVSITDPIGRPLRSYLVRGDGTASEEAPTRVVSGYYYRTASGRDYGKLDAYRDARNVDHYFSYDKFGRAASHQRRKHAGGGTGEVYTTYLYDILDRVTEISEHIDSAVPPITVISRSYDSYGSILRERISRGTASSTVSVADALYDAAGRRQDLKADFNNTSAVSLVSPASFTTAGGWHFDWSGDGHLRQVKSAAGNYEYGWSDSGRILWKYGQNPWWITQRDPNGRIQQKASAAISSGYVLAKGASMGGGGNGGADLGSGAPFTISPQPGFTGPLQSVPLMTENMTWAPDGLQQTYQKSQRLPSGQIAADQRSYQYGTRRKLISESYGPAGGGSTTMAYTFDHGRPDGLGVLVRASSGSDAAATLMTYPPGVKSGQLRDFTLNYSPRFISSTGRSPGAGSVGLEVFSLAGGQRQYLATYPPRGLEPLLQTFGGPSDPAGNWTGIFRLEPGPYELLAKAIHPGGPASVSAVRPFTVMPKAQPMRTADTTLQYDNDGNVTRRGNQTLTWDLAGRLIQVQEIDPVSQAGYLWKAQYDGLNRRIYTDTVALKQGVYAFALDQVETVFDPAAEFLELGLRITRYSGGIPSTEKVWKVHGPDLNGSYGGMMGTGGLEATVSSIRGTEQVWKDAFGHVFPLEDPSRQAIGYGAKPGSPALTLSEGASVLQATGWRGRRTDITGLICLGARYYSPAEGRFLSPDPAGHASSPSLYDFAGGDPVNFFDPDGRFSRAGNADLSTGSEIMEARLPGLLNPPPEKIMTHEQWVEKDAEGRSRGASVAFSNVLAWGYNHVTPLPGDSLPYLQNNLVREDPGWEALGSLSETALGLALAILPFHEGAGLPGGRWRGELSGEGFVSNGIATSMDGPFAMGKPMKVGDIDALLRKEGILPDNYSLDFKSRILMKVYDPAGYAGKESVQAGGTLRTVDWEPHGNSGRISIGRGEDGTIPISLDGRLTRNLDELRGIVAHEVAEGNVLIQYEGQFMRNQARVNIGESAHAAGLREQEKYRKK